MTACIAAIDSKLHPDTITLTLLTNQTMSSHSKTENITINATLISHALAGARSAGIDIEALLKRCDIEPNDFENPEYRVPAANVVKLMHVCRWRLKDEMMGLADSTLPLGYFRMSVFIALHQENLGQALARYIEFNNIFVDCLTFSMEKEADNVHLIFTQPESATIKNNVLIDTTMAIMHRLTGWLCNELIVPKQVDLEYPKPPHFKEYHYLYYGAPINYNSPQNRITINKQYLELPLVQNNTTAEAYIRRAPLDILLPHDIRGATSQAVQQTIKDIFIQQQRIAELKEVSALLDIGAQTLRRLLSKEGTSFHDIKSQVRRDFAMHYLDTPELSIEEISALIGYSEPASFIRAFKSWTGFSPARFRKGEV